MKQFYILLLVMVMIIGNTDAQNYVPVTVTGFNQDGFAESGTNAAAVTSLTFDLTNHIMYTAAFATTNGIVGGVVDNGTIVSGTHTFQLAPYTGNNALFTKRGEIRPLTLTTPAAYGNISLLVFSTEGNSLVNVSFGFTDGTTTAYLTNYTMLDWFNGTTNIAYQNFGRITRLTAPPYALDGYPINPRFYYVDIPLSCADRSKLLQTITFSNVTTAGTNAPYPNAVSLAVSGSAFQQTVNTSSTPATCSGPGGTATVTVVGNTGPYTYSWNSTPVQTTSAAVNLPGGTYTVTITDASGCTRTATVIVTGGTTPPVPSATGITVCNGASATLVIQNPVAGYTYNWYTAATGGTLAGTGATFTVNNVTNTTTYYVDATNSGCTSARSAVVITALPVVATPTATGGTICSGNSAIFSVVNPIAGVSYNWYTAATGGALVGTTSTITVTGITINTTYYVEAVSNGCLSAGRGSATVSVLPVLSTPVVTLTGATANSLTFSWTAVPGATGYLVSTDGVNFITPSSGATGTTHVVTGLAPSQTVTLRVRALGTLSCQTSADGTANGITLTNQIFVPNAFTPNGDGNNDFLLVYGGTIATMDMKIFDQWGELIFESTNQSKGWDGTYKGKKMPVGVYVYILKAIRFDGTVFNKKGSINLIR